MKLRFRLFSPIGCKRGFTLAEIVVYTALLSIVLTSLFAVVNWVYKINSKMQIVREVTNNARQAMEAMAYEIRSAEAIYASTTNSTQLSLKTKHYLPGGESLAYIDFFQCGSRLCLKTESNPPWPITAEKLTIMALNFQRISQGAPSGSLKIHFELGYYPSSGMTGDNFIVKLDSTTALRH